MALVGAGFSMRPARRGGVARMIGGGVAAGFALFMISKIAEEFGQSGALPVLLAAWVPAASGLMLADRAAAAHGRRLTMTRAFLACSAGAFAAAAGCRPTRSSVRCPAMSATIRSRRARNPSRSGADQVQYDQQNNLVIATGHVEAWQNGHVLRADKIVFDRNTGTAAATGHVVLLEPDGEVMFADYAEMTQDMNDGVLKDMRALLAQNGKLAANGVRRTAGKINELSRVVYSPCNLCKKDPTRPPLWQIRANSGVQDLENKRDEYYDAVLEMFGWPVAWFPYISAPDPSVKRASGLLMPSIGDLQPSRRFRRPAVLPGHRRPVGCHLHAGADDPDGSAAQPGISPPLQRRLPAVGDVRRLCRQLAAGHLGHQGPVRLRRYLALGLRHQPGIVVRPTWGTSGSATASTSIPTC